MNPKSTHPEIPVLLPDIVKGNQISENDRLRKNKDFSDEADLIRFIQVIRVL